MLRLPFYLQAFLLGLQHSFEPDHMAAVSVLATDKRSLRDTLKPILWRSSQWALGHSFTLMLLSLAALLFKSSLPQKLSEMVEIWVIGPLMIALGCAAIYRAFATYSHTHVHSHQKTEHKHPHILTEEKEEHVHVHSHVKTRITLFNRSFAVGMLHGIAGTGGALAIALGLAADNVQMALTILLVESLGVLAAMLIYSLLLTYALRSLAQRHTMLLKVVNLAVGGVSIAVGCLWLYRSFI